MLLTVKELPSISTQPLSTVTCSGSGAMLSVAANGAAPLSYQWYKDGTALPTATLSNLLIGSATTADAGTYYVKVTNSCGVETSQSASLTVNEPVSLTAQSVSQTACSGSSVNFSVTASGTAPFTYQWYKDGAIITGATNNQLILNSVDSSDAASYYVVVSNTCNSVQSNNMTLTINEAPTINNQPVSTTVCSGTGVQLSVSVSGTSPLSYQWYKGGSAISGETNSNLIISSASATDAGSYYVEITNSCGTQTSQTAALTVNEPVSLTAQSLSQTVCSGSSLSFNVTAAGTTPVTYQWFKDNDTITGATNNSLSLSAVDTSDQATYYVIATNSCNSVQSNAMALTVNEAPSIITQPVSSVSCSGSSTMLSVTASGTAPVSFQWYKGTSAVPGATSSNYLISSTTVSDAGSYYCTVSNGCGTETSNPATLVVNEPVIITAQSGDSTKCVGDAMMFTISTNGTAPVYYQWFHNGDTIVGATSAVYSIASVSSPDAGNYYCITSNACASTQSGVKALTVNVAPAINSITNDTTICSGNNLTLSVSASGSAPLSYQWYKNGSVLGGALSSLYPMYQISTSDSGTYYSVVSNSCGSVQSANVVVGVNTPPAIVYQSGDSSRCEGESMTFKVVATGTAPLSYQWYFGQNAISGADSNVYQIAAVSPSDDGYYNVEVSNQCATTTSANKYLTVHPTPNIALGPDTTFCDGGSIIIGPGYGYYCLWNTGQIAGQINVTDSGSYSAVVTDNYGCTGTTDTINVNVVYPYSYQDICIVTVDSASGKNVVVWEKTPNMGISSFNIYKETNISGVYALMANRPYDSLSVVVDMASNPAVSAERYVITVVDTCGNESSYSPAHRTMHLTVNKGQNNDWNLIWNAYEGFVPNSYIIYRADSTKNFVSIDTVSGSSNYTYLYTDQNAPINTPLYYYVEIVHPTGGCSVSKGKTNYLTSRSNHAHNGAANPSSLLPAFFGTPTSGVFPLDVHFFDQSQGNPTEWEWDFGDGTVDTVQNPTHTYTQIGVYSVSLIVKNTTGLNSVSFQNYITVLTTGIEDVSDEFVVKVFPNPYTGKTNIAYALNKRSMVHIEIFNAVGMKVAELVNDYQNPGSYKYQFRAQEYGFSAGVYYLRMRVDDNLYTEKLIEVK
jgi:PKD repeat protein